MNFFFHSIVDQRESLDFALAGIITVGSISKPQTPKSVTKLESSYNHNILECSIKHYILVAQNIWKKVCKIDEAGG